MRRRQAYTAAAAIAAGLVLVACAAVALCAGVGAPRPTLSDVLGALNVTALFAIQLRGGFLRQQPPHST